MYHRYLTSAIATALDADFGCVVLQQVQFLPQVAEALDVRGLVGREQLVDLTQCTLELQAGGTVHLHQTESLRHWTFFRLGWIPLKHVVQQCSCQDN